MKIQKKRIKLTEQIAKEINNQKTHPKNKRTANTTPTSIYREHSVDSVQDTRKLHNILNSKPNYLFP